MVCVVIDRHALDVWVVEDSEPELDAEHAAHSLVENLHGDCAVLDTLFKIIGIYVVAHIHVNSRVERETRGVRAVLGNAVLDELDDGVVVADHIALEAHFAAEHIGEEIAV